MTPRPSSAARGFANPVAPARACIFAFALLVALSGATTASAADPTQPGEFKLSTTDVGATVDLAGKWLFKPTYALADRETPDKSEDATGYFPVPVPQMLSRIQWWLDDSDDFKKWEDARLKALGFDTDKSDEGWYRAAIDIPALPKDRHVWIEFDGVAMRCKPFINGHPLGEEKGMFHRFSYDLTEHLKPGKNTLAVWVSMEKIPKTEGNLGEAVTVNLSAAKVISMSKGMFGPLSPNQDNRAYDLYGIWQPVKLVVRGAGKIRDVYFRSADTFQNSNVAVDTDTAGRPAVVKAEFRRPGGETFAVLKGTVDEHGHVVLGAEHGGSVEVKPWTPAQPTLYRLDVTLESPDGQPLDKWSQKIGFRTFEVKGNQFYLNGHPYWLRGGNQLPYGKNPWDPQLPKKLIQLLHDSNVRFTRTHATSWNEAWLDAADSIGLAVSIEGIRPWAFAGKQPAGQPQIMPPPAIFQHWLMENGDVVKRCRNHPSVFIFTVGNEMLLRDAKNLDKWKLLSEVTKQTRSLAPDRPIVCSSDYVRDPEFYQSTLKPAGIDDGDVDDMHRYNGWYADSGFVVDAKFEKEAKANGGTRPLMGQEFATGYPDLDTGLPVLRYTRDLLTPQAWVGRYAYPGNDPAIWLNHHAVVTKRWAEELRYQRGSTTAGFALFSTECWFHHSFLPDATPYPVVESVKQAWAPVGVALETTRRRFYAGETVDTNVYVTNDDEQFRSFDDLTVQIGFTDSRGSAIRFIDAGPQAKIPHLDYYQTAKLPVHIKVPADLPGPRQALPLTVRVVTKDALIATTDDPVEVFSRPAPTQPAATQPSASPPNVITVAAGQPLAPLGEGQSLRKQVEAGATAIVFSPAKEIVSLFPADLLDAKADVGEFADWSPCAGTKLAKNLQPMDLKWWARKGDWRAFVATGSHRLKPGGKARELVRYIPAHSYISAEKVPDQYRVVLCEIPLGKGRLWICDLDLAASADVDPAARLFADNLYRAAADPQSTANLPKLPTHEEMLKGAK